MSLIYCTCKEPIASPNPRANNQCLRCVRQINPAVVSSNETVKAFFDRMETVFPGEPPDSFLNFRDQCEAREKAGRSVFGLAYLKRDNPREALEEAADAANYFMFDWLQNLQRTGGDEELDLVLTGAWHAFKLHQTALELMRKRRGWA